jgi:hypothetical protein
MNVSPIAAAARLGAVVVLVTAGGVMCTTASSVGPDDTVAPGSWGGNHVAMEVTATGATLEFDCAHARIDEPLALDRTGRFTVRGTYSAERGGPVRETEDDRSRPARFAGRVTGTSMSLTISAAAGDEPLGTFNLEHGKNGVVRKCL